MQVLGDLIYLPDNEEKGLPLPWWHRAPLGLSKNTRVYIALTVASEDRPVGDLIVTVLKPRLWNRMFRLDCYQSDRPGLVAEVFERVYPLNIALAETAKLEKGGLHHVSLICEPEPTYSEQDTEKEVRRIEEELTANKWTVNVEPLSHLPDLTWHCARQVDHGWVKGVEWRDEVETRHSKTVEKADLGKAVISADTESRVLRFVFPRKGAMTVSIWHADEPGALAEITKSLKSCNLNILSAFLRRSGGGGQDAELVAVCEPEDELDVEGTNRLKEEIKENISKIPHYFRAQRLDISDGKNADERIYPRHPEDVVARVPANLSWAVQELKGQLDNNVNSKKLPIFLSRRFPKDSRSAAGIAANVRRALRDNECIPMEALPTTGRDPNTIYTEVSSKMWASKAGIVLITKVPDGTYISANLAHEYGFLLGQGKSVLMLVENEPECTNAITNSFSNLAGVVYRPFNPTADDDDPESVHSRITEWIKGVNEDPGSRTGPHV